MTKKQKDIEVVITDYNTGTVYVFIVPTVHMSIAEIEEDKPKNIFVYHNNMPKRDGFLHNIDMLDDTGNLQVLLELKNPIVSVIQAQKTKKTTKRKTNGK